MTEAQKDAVYAAYTGICVLKSMCRKADLSLAESRSADLIKEMSDAFPWIGGWVARSALRHTPTPPSQQGSAP